MQKKALSYLTLFVLFCPFFLGGAEVTAATTTKKGRTLGRQAQPVQQTRQIFGPETSLLHDDSLEGWVSLGGKTPGKGWSVQDGILHLKGKGGDIRSKKQYKNFVLDFSWTIAKGGNSGIKYRLKKFGDKWLGMEYQVLDDFNTDEGKKPKNNAGTLYDLLPCSTAYGGKKTLNPHTELNHGRIMVNGNHVQHWINGKKVVDVRIGSKRWKNAVAASKFNEDKGYATNSTGFIMIQDHWCEVWFHKISIREIQNIPANWPNTPKSRPNSK